MKNVIIFGTGRFYKAREEYLKNTYKNDLYLKKIMGDKILSPICCA